MQRCLHRNPLPDCLGWRTGVPQDMRDSNTVTLYQKGETRDCSFHDYMKDAVVFDGSTSDTFNRRSIVKQGCVLAPTLLEIFFAILLKHAIGPSNEGINLPTRSDGNLFSNACQIEGLDQDSWEVLLADFLLPMMQQLPNTGGWTTTTQHESRTIGLKKTPVTGQDVVTPPDSKIFNQQLDAVHDFTYLGSTIITDYSLSLDSEFNNIRGKEATTMSSLSKRVWTNSKVTKHTKKVMV